MSAAAQKHTNAKFVVGEMKSFLCDIPTKVLINEELWPHFSQMDVFCFGHVLADTSKCLVSLILWKGATTQDADAKAELNCAPQKPTSKSKQDVRASASEQSVKAGNGACVEVLDLARGQIWMFWICWSPLPVMIHGVTRGKRCDSWVLLSEFGRKQNRIVTQTDDLEESKTKNDWMVFEGKTIWLHIQLAWQNLVICDQNDFTWKQLLAIVSLQWGTMGANFFHAVSHLMPMSWWHCWMKKSFSKHRHFRKNAKQCKLNCKNENFPVGALTKWCTRMIRAKIQTFQFEQCNWKKQQRVSFLSFSHKTSFWKSCSKCKQRKPHVSFLFSWQKATRCQWFLFWFHNSCKCIPHAELRLQWCLTSQHNKNELLHKRELNCLTCHKSNPQVDDNVAKSSTRQSHDQNRRTFVAMMLLHKN